MKSLAQAFKYILLFTAAFLAAASLVHASTPDSFAEAARDLAGSIVSKMGPPENTGFTFQVLASIGAEEAAAAREFLEAELQSRGVRFVPEPEAAWKLQVTLSENLLQYIWIAELQRGPDRVLVMKTQPRRPDTPPEDAALRMTIQSKLIYEQDGPILDLKLLEEEMLVLSPARLTLYRRQNDQWVSKHSAPINSVLPFPRDIRGRLSGDGDAVQVWLPGLTCSGRINPEFSVECSQKDTAWQFELGNVELAPMKNFFVKVNLPPFFSASVVRDEGTDLWVIAGVDGRTYLFTKDLKQVGTIEHLGSDIAVVESGCGTGQQLLAVLRTDPPEPGGIQAFQIVHQESMAVSSAAEFAGPITALWPIHNQNAAIAVSRNPKTGRYAAFHLSISCSH